MDPDLLLLPLFDLSNNGISSWCCLRPDCSYVLQVPSKQYAASHEHRIAPALEGSEVELLVSRLRGDSRRDAIGNLLRRLVGDPVDPAFSRKLMTLVAAYPIEEGSFVAPSDKPAQRKTPEVVHRYRECVLPRSARYRTAPSKSNAPADCPSCASFSPADFRAKLATILVGTMLFAFGPKEEVGPGYLQLQRRLNLGPERNLTTAQLYREYFQRAEQRARSDVRLVEEGRRNERGNVEEPLPADFFQKINASLRSKRERPIALEDVIAAGKKSKWMKLYREL